MKRILVCGSRHFPDYVPVYAALDKIVEKHGDPILVVHGGAPGADEFADEWAKLRSMPVWVFPAKWEEFGRSAGPIRNGQMLKRSDPDAIVAFPGGTGTQDMIDRAKHSGVPVWEPLA